MNCHLHTAEDAVQDAADVLSADAILSKALVACGHEPSSFQGSHIIVCTLVGALWHADFFPGNAFIWNLLQEVRDAVQTSAFLVVRQGDVPWRHFSVGSIHHD